MSSRLWMSRGSTSSRLPRDILPQSDIAGSLPNSHHNNNHYQQVRWQIMERWSNIAVIAQTNFVPYLMLPLGSLFSAIRSGSSQCLAALPNRPTHSSINIPTRDYFLPSFHMWKAADYLSCLPHLVEPLSFDFFACLQANFCLQTSFYLKDALQASSVSLCHFRSIILPPSSLFRSGLFPPLILLPPPPLFFQPWAAFISCSCSCYSNIHTIRASQYASQMPQRLLSNEKRTNVSGTSTYRKVSNVNVLYVRPVSQMQYRA